MKKRFRLLALAMVAVLSMGLLCACGSDDADETEATGKDSSTQMDSTSDESSGTAAETEDVIGEITYISSTYMSLDVYEPEEEVSDYASLDVSTLTATYSTESVTVDTDAEYYYISDSSMVSQTADDLEEGDMVAVTTSADGTQQIILLEKGDGDSTGSGTEDTVSGTDYIGSGTDGTVSGAEDTGSSADSIGSYDAG